MEQKNSEFEYACKIYQSVGVNVMEAIRRATAIPISVHCWQCDDIRGFSNGEGASGGIQTTGDYPGRAKNFEEMKSDLHEAFYLIPGEKRLNIHALYAVGECPRRDALTPEHFLPWMEFAKNEKVMMDFNGSFFSHPMAKDGMTLSHPDKEVRDFWIRHAKCCRKIAAYIGEKQGSPCLCNIWIPDGLKDIPADRMTPRERLKESLDEVYEEKYSRDFIIDCVESKVFGIGVESYTVGSAEFYMGYAATRGVNVLIDNGHYHPTENVADKISSALLFFERLALHITRSVRWDSDHVVLFDDTTRELAEEILHSGKAEKVSIGLDYFDASINRVSALVIGARNLRKALLYAALEPIEKYRALQEDFDFTALMSEREENKSLPFGIVWSEYLRSVDCPDREWMEEVVLYEKNVMRKRK